MIFNSNVLYDVTIFLVAGKHTHIINMYPSI